MCNFSVFCKYQIKIIVRSPGTRSTGTPQQAERDAEHPGPSAAPQPQAGHRSSPNRPGAAAQTRGKHKQHHKLPATAAALGQLRLLAAGSSLSHVLSRGLSTRPRQGRTWALLGKQRDGGSSLSPVLGTLCRPPQLLTATERNAAGAPLAHGGGSLDSQRTRYKPRSEPREQRWVILLTSASLTSNSAVGY